MPSDSDPLALLRTRGYIKLLVLAGLVGVPVSVAAYGFLKVVAWLQDELFTELPEALGFDAAPTWWPLPLLALSGLLVALARLRNRSRQATVAAGRLVLAPGVPAVTSSPVGGGAARASNRSARQSSRLRWTGRGRCGRSSWSPSSKMGGWGWSARSITRWSMGLPRCRSSA